MMNSNGKVIATLASRFYDYHMLPSSREEIYPAAEFGTWSRKYRTHDLESTKHNDA